MLIIFFKLLLVFFRSLEIKLNSNREAKTMLKKFFLLSVTAFVLFAGYDADGFTLKKGTVSVGGASTLSAVNRDSDQTDSTNSIGASVSMGYFVRDNLELGGNFSASYMDRDSGDTKGFSISPYLTYHFDLNEKSNIYLTGMIGLSKIYSDYGSVSSDSDGTILSSEIGWEYCFTPSVSGTIGVRYEREDLDYKYKSGSYHDDEDSTSTMFGTVLGLKIYF